MKKVLLSLLTICLVTITLTAQFTDFTTKIKPKYQKAAIEHDVDNINGLLVFTDSCDIAADLTDLLGAGEGNTQSSMVFSNVNSTVPVTEVTTGFDCFFDETLENTVWFTFTGDGNRYFIETADCGVTDYIDMGDTQMALYSGTSCMDLTPIACSEDLDYPTSLESGVSIETEDGVVYYIMVDGYDGADGEFCMNVTQLAAPITCAEIAVGTAGITNVSICFGDTLQFGMTGGETVIPELQTGINGFIWAVFSADVSGSTSPFTDLAFLGAFGGIQPGPVDIDNPYDENLGLTEGTYYLTPVVLGGAEDTDGTFSGLDFTNGCVLTGTSVEFTLLPEYTEPSVTAASTDETTPPGGNGEASVSVADGSGSFSYLWSNGEMTAAITGLDAGIYTVTITDDSGCFDDIIEEITVDEIVDVNEITSTRYVELFPNPANTQATISYAFNQPIDLEVSLMNSLGQLVFVNEIDQALEGTLEWDLSTLTNGVYFVRITDGAKQNMRRLVISK